MTAAEWAAATYPASMLPQVAPGLGARVLRLYAAASCRRAWAELSERGRRVVELAEQWADRETSWRVVAAERGRLDLTPATTSETARRCLLTWACYYAGARTLVEVNRANWRVTEALAPDPDRPRHDPEQCDLLRDLVGDPFRADGAALKPQPDAVAWATSAYERREFSTLPMLADLLEEHGCGDAALLDHLRGPGPHARGCWAVDRVLGQRPPG